MSATGFLLPAGAQLRARTETARSAPSASQWREAQTVPSHFGRGSLAASSRVILIAP